MIAKLRSFAWSAALAGFAALSVGGAPRAAADPQNLGSVQNLALVGVEQDAGALVIRVQFDPPPFPVCPPYEIAGGYQVEIRDVAANSSFESATVGSFGPDFPGTTTPGQTGGAYHANGALLQEGRDYDIRVHYFFSWNSVPPDPPQHFDVATSPMQIRVTATLPQALTIDPSAIDFGRTPVNASVSKPFSVKNTSSSKLTVSVDKPSKPFFVVGNTSFSLDPGQTTNLYARVAPGAAGAVDGTITMKTGAGDSFPVALHVDAVDDCRAAPIVCAPGEFTPWTGAWSVETALDPLPDMPDGLLRLTQRGRVVTGHLTYTGPRGTADLPISGTSKFVKGKGGAESFVLAARVDHKVDGGGTTDLVLVMPLTLATTRAYRRIDVASPKLGLPGLLETPGDPFQVSGANPYHFDLESRDDDQQATLCTTIRAGARSVKSGKSVTFVCTVVNTGPACVPSDRLVLTIDVTGGTIDAQHVVGVRSPATQVVGERLIVTLGSLGDGRKPADALAGALFFVTADDDATEVKCTATVDDPGAQADPLVNAQTPPETSACVPVIEPTPSTK